MISGKALWVLMIVFFSPATGQMDDYQIGLFFSREGCEYAAMAITKLAAETDGYLPVEFSCTEIKGL